MPETQISEVADTRGWDDRPDEGAVTEQARARTTGVLTDAAAATTFCLVVAGIELWWAGVHTEALLLGSWGLCAVTLLWLAGRVAAGGFRQLPMLGLGGVVSFGLLAGAHLMFPPEQHHDPYFQEQWTFVLGTRTGCVVPLDAGLRSLWFVGLMGSCLALGDILRRRQHWRSKIALALGVPALALAVAGGIWKVLGWSPFDALGRPVSERPFATFFHDIAAGSWMHLILATIGVGAAGLVERRRGRLLIVIPFCMAIGLIGFAQASHKSDAGHLLYAAVVLWLVVGAVFMSLQAKMRGERSEVRRDAPSSKASAGKGGPSRRLVLAVLVFGAMGAGFWFDSREYYPTLKPDGDPFEERAPGEDRLLRSEDPRMQQFFGDRRMAWGAGLRMVAASPLIGWGPVGWVNYYDRFTADPLLRSFFLYMQFTHNDVLQFLLEWGLLGCVSLALVGAQPVRYCLRALVACIVKRRAGRAGDAFVAWCVLTGLGAVLVHAQIDFPLQVPAVQVLVAGVLALGASARR